jgi:nucleotide-binding universal stress UspA family protein
MKKIMCAVDGSLASIHAANKAMELAGSLGAKVTLIHVTPPTILPGDVPMAPIAELRESELARGAAVLQEVVKALGGGVKVETKNLLGPPAEMISDAALEDGCEMVVVGNKGRNAVSRVLLGSVADRLVHICKRPVLVVR